MIVTLTEINHLELLYPQKHLMRKRICLFILLVSQVFISSVYGTNPVTQLIKDFNITNQSPNIELNSYLGAYNHPNLIYISFQGKKLQPKFPEHSPWEESKTLFQLVSAGFGYQKFTSPTQSFGGYVFLDIAPSLGYRHLNIGLQKSENVWQFHVNGYLPLSNSYYPEFGIPQPEIEERVKNEQGKVCLQKSYYVEKGNFGVDFIISHLHTLFKGLTFSVGPYYFYNGYDQSHVLGGAEEFEYTINPYCSLYQKLTYDPVNTMVLKAGLTLNLLGSSSQSETSFFVQPQWITNKRHLSPRYLLSTTLQEIGKDVKTKREKYENYQGTEEEKENIYYETDTPDSPSEVEDDNASYRSRNEQKPYRVHKKKREKSKGKSEKVSFSFSKLSNLFKSSREKKSNKNSHYDEKKASQKRKEQEKTHQFKSRSKTHNTDSRKERMERELEEELERQKKEAYRVLQGYSNKEINTRDDLEKLFRKLVLQYHPDKNKGNEEEVAKAFAEIKKAVDTLRPHLPKNKLT